MMNWKALDNVPLLFYILALKTLVLCLGFAGVKIYQSRKIDEALKKEKEEKRLLAQKTQELLDNLDTQEQLDTMDTQGQLDIMESKKND